MSSKAPSIFLSLFGNQFIHDLVKTSPNRKQCQNKPQEIYFRMSAILVRRLFVTNAAETERPHNNTVCYLSNPFIS